MESSLKTCTKCKETKPLTDFCNLQRNKDGLHSNCRICKQKSERDYFHQNPHAKAKRLINNRLFKYNINIDQFNGFLIKQNYCCAICKIHLDEQTFNTTSHIDHCHLTNKVRGLLCSQCNVGLGHFYDSEDSLLNAVAYLRDNK